MEDRTLNRRTDRHFITIDLASPFWSSWAVLATQVSRNVSFMESEHFWNITLITFLIIDRLQYRSGVQNRIKSVQCRVQNQLLSVQ